MGAATEVFGAQGLGAPLEDVARAAGVSIGTLYNRFGSREALIDAVITELAAGRLREVAEEAARQPDPWSRFRHYLTGLLEMQAAYPFLDDVMAMRFPESTELVKLCEEAGERASVLIEAAQADGSLRPDFGLEDLTAFFLANGGMLCPSMIDEAARRRHLDFLFDGLRADRALPG